MLTDRTIRATQMPMAQTVYVCEVYQKLKSKCSPCLSPEANQRSAVEKGKGSAITLMEETGNSVPGL